MEVSKSCGVLLAPLEVPACKCRYLCNVGEGFQRFATQHQVNFKYLADILLTRVSSDAAGGLPGEGMHALPHMHACAWHSTLIRLTQV